MKKKRKILKIFAIIISSLIFVSAAITIFSNISFEATIIFVDKFPISEDDREHYNRPPRGGTISRRTIEGRNSRITWNDQFNQFIWEFDPVDYILAYSRKLPIKRVTYRYDIWDFLGDVIGFTSHPARLRRWYTIELDESVEQSPYFFLYKLSG